MFFSYERKRYITEKSEIERIFNAYKKVARKNEEKTFHGSAKNINLCGIIA